MTLRDWLHDHVYPHVFPFYARSWCLCRFGRHGARLCGWIDNTVFGE